MVHGPVILLWVRQRYSEPNKECGILDHVFATGEIKWDVYVRVVTVHTGVYYITWEPLTGSRVG
jgi:hypothetical protein